MKVVLDTNVIISGILWQGITKEIFDLAEADKIIICITPSIISEVNRVLRYSHIKKKIESIGSTAGEVTSYLLEISQQYPDVDIDVTLADPHDVKFLAAAIMSGADYLITGDKKHLLWLKSFGATKIFSPREFLGKKI